MKRSVILLLILAFAAFTAAGLIGGCANGEKTDVEPIKIGVLGPMDFIFGEHHWYGALMAEAEINKDGGILVGEERRPIQLVKIDTNEMLSVPDAVSAIEKAISVDKVDFLVGGFRTEAVMAMQDIAMENKVIFMGCGPAAPALCDRVTEDYDTYKYWFRVTPVNSMYMIQLAFLQLQNVAEIMREELGIDTIKVALLVESIAAWDPVLANAQQVLPQMGMEVVGAWRPSATETDVTAELTAIEASGAHVIFTFLSGPVGVAYARQWGEMEIPAVSVGANPEAQKGGFWDATGGYGNYEYTFNMLGRVAVNETTIPFYDAFVEKFDEPPIYSAATYDAILILAEAITRAGTLDSDAVVVEVENTDIIVPAGRIVFTESHDVTFGPEYILYLGTQWRDGELKVVWPWDWNGLTYEGSVKFEIPPWVVEKWAR